MSDKRNEGHELQDPLAIRRLLALAYLDLSRIHRVLERRMARLFADSGLEGVTPAQSGLLMTLLQQKQSMTARRLSEVMALSEVTVGRFVHALEKNGWVSRRPAPQDARARFVEPTQKTFETLPIFFQIFNQLLDELFEGFEEEEIATLAKSVKQVLVNLESKD